MYPVGDVTDFPFKNNVPDPLVSEKELPTFKFALEQSAGKVIGGSFGKEATVEQLPISKGIAGVCHQRPIQCYAVRLARPLPD